MSVFLFAGFMFLFAAVTAILLKKRFEQVLPCCIFYIILVLYISGLVSNFVPGLYLIWATLPLTGILCLLSSKKNLFKDIKTYVITPGFFFILIAYAAFLPCILQMHLHSWDEFSHWGTVIKNFWYLNDFANLENATTQFKEYPPAASLFAYFAQRIGNHYVECKSYGAYIFLYLALMSPYFTIIKTKKDYPKAILLGFCSILLPTLMWERIYDVLYVDALLGLEMALMFVIYLFYEDGKWKFCSLGMTTAILCLTKASGAGLATIAFFIFVISELCQLKSRTKPENRQSLILLGTTLACLFAGKYSWEFYLKLSGTKPVWNYSDINAATIWELLTGQAPAYRYETIHNFMHTAAVSPFSSPILPISCLGWIVFYAITGILIAFFIKGTMKKKKINACIWGLFIGSIFYACSLLILYLFTFSQGEALKSASFDRYIGSYLIAMAAVIMVLFFQYQNSKIGLAVFSLWIGLTTYLPIYKAIATATPVCADEYKNGTLDAIYLQVKEEVLDKYRGKPVKLWYVHQNDSGFWYWICRYGITPWQMQSNGRWTFSPDAQKDAWETELREENYTHVWLYGIDETFLDIFSEMFDNRQGKAEPGVYEITCIDNQLKFKKVWEYHD